MVSDENCILLKTELKMKKTMINSKIILVNFYINVTICFMNNKYFGSFFNILTHKIIKNWHGFKLYVFRLLP